jgi:hypothetical protein
VHACTSSSRTSCSARARGAVLYPVPPASGAPIPPAR